MHCVCLLLLLNILLQNLQVLFFVLTFASVLLCFFNIIYNLFFYFSFAKQNQKSVLFLYHFNLSWLTCKSTHTFLLILIIIGFMRTHNQIHFCIFFYQPISRVPPYTYYISCTYITQLLPFISRSHGSIHQINVANNLQLDPINLADRLIKSLLLLLLLLLYGLLHHTSTSCINHI